MRVTVSGFGTVAGKNTSAKTEADARKSVASERSNEVLDAIQLPVLSVVVSGGHTQFFLIEADKKTQRRKQIDRRYTKRQTQAQESRDIPRLAMAQDGQDDTATWLTSGRFSITLLGQSVDDAAGEALDKIGRMINLGYSRTSD